MDETPLSFKDQDLMVLVLEDQIFGCPTDKIGYDAIDRVTITFNHDSCLASGQELGIVTALFESICDFNGRDHFADTAIIADGMDTETTFTEWRTASNFLEIVLAHIDEFYLVAGCCRGKLFVLGNEVVQSRDHVHAPLDGSENDHSPGLRDLASRWGNPDEQRIGLCRFIQVRDEGDAGSGPQYLFARLSCVGAVEYGNHFLGSIAKNATGGLGRMWVRVSLGQDY
jgi:hypothetical protein